LPYYAGYFNAVELSETHDTIPAADTVAKWNKAVEKDVFKFCPQFYKGISHTGNIDIHKTGLTNSFISRLSILKEKLGTAVLEIREGTPFEQKDRLLKYLETLPQDFPVSLDIKSPEWFSNGELFHEFVKSLHRINKGLVITDSPGRRALVHMQLATSTAYVRFVCEGWNEIDLFRISEWKRQLKSWFAVGLEKCFFMLHIHNREGMEDFINYVREELDF
jgi:uncharacterized protein YecE (DUF72 family)